MVIIDQRRVCLAGPANGRQEGELARTGIRLLVGAAKGRSPLERPELEDKLGVDAKCLAVGWW